MTLTIPHSLTKAPTQFPRCWVGCLGCYTAGRLVGDWFDAASAPQDSQDLRQAGVFLPWCHYAEGHEEIWVFDHEGFGGLLVGECSPAHAQALAELVAEANRRSLPLAVVAHWIENGNDPAEGDALLDDLQDAYCGRYDTGAEYAQELADDVGFISDALAWPLTCIDWAHAWDELRTGGDNYAIPAPDGGLYILRTV